MTKFTLNEATDNRELFWTCIDIANNYGQDKLLLTERVQLVIDNLDNLRTTFIDASEKNSLTLRAIEALEDIMEGKQPNHFVHLDSTNSALQFYSVLTGDKRLAETCNLSPIYDSEGIEVRTDAYAILRDDLNETFGQVLFNRNDCKPVLMQTLYGSQNAWKALIDPTKDLDDTRHNRLDEDGQIIWIELTSGKVLPAKLPSEFDYAHLDFIHKYINPDAEFNDLVEIENGKGVDEFVMEALWTSFPVAMETLELILSFHSIDYKYYTWKDHRGFNARSNVKIKEVEVVTLDLGFNEPVDIAVSSRKLGYKPVSAALAPDIIHNFDAGAVDYIGCHFDDLMVPMVSIHDDFGVPATHCDELVKTYKDYLINILENNYLNDVLKQLPTCPASFEFVKHTTLTADDIRACEFTLS